MLRVGNAQGFWGDVIDAAERLARDVPDLDYLTLDYLSEVSLSIMAIQRGKNPEMGYAKDFLSVIESLLPLWKEGRRLRVLSNAGGLNPAACARACREILKGTGLKVAVVTGDEVFNQLKAVASNPSFRNMDSGAELTTVVDRLETANVYVGAHPLVEALERGADIVIAGRVADPSLTVAPAVYHYGWAWDDYDKLAAATVAGHLIECGTQVTGGISTNWWNIADPVNMGFPFVEIEESGAFTVTKSEGSGGAVTIETVKEQLLYEIQDPKSYLSPDVSVSFLGVEVEKIGEDRVAVRGARGAAPPEQLKVNATYRDGYRAEGMLVVFGHRAVDKAKRCGEVILERVARAGFDLDRKVVECLGAGAAVPGVQQEEHPASIEVVLRVAVADCRREAVERFTKEIAPLVTGGAPGVTGYSSGRPKVRPVYGFWPCLIAREVVKMEVSVDECSPT